MDPAVDEILSRVRAYYERDGIGGSLHIVLDDGNIETEHVRFCYGLARDEGDAEGMAICDLLLRMTEAQRFELSALMS